MKDKIKRYVLVLGLLTISIVKFTLASQANELSNELLAWGFRRGENHTQPVLDSKSLKVINEYNGIAMGNANDKYVYLTFDAGYEAGYTESILKALEENNVTAAFFITGHYLNTATDLVKKMIEGGNVVGNHTPKCLMSGNDIKVKC